MNERKKIVIPTGGDADDSLSTPHFDTEATLTARPVVPLAEGVAGQAYDSGRLRTGKSWNPLLLVLIVLGAVGLGVATGLAIGFYRNRQASAPPVASESSAPTQDINAGKTVEPPAPIRMPLPTPQEEEARASIPEVAEEPSIQPEDEKPERTASNERDDADDDRKATPPVVPENRRERDDTADEDNDNEERRAERQKRREERRERRRRERDLEEPARFPRDIERAGREQINRIRDIFEGKQP